MQFKFDANQEYQINAIDSVVNLLAGQPRNETGIQFALGSIISVPNMLDLEDNAILENLQAVQSQNNLPIDNELKSLEDSIETIEDKKTARFLNFSIEMETGTGKTYIYLRTALELFRRYGLRKFIIVVPSIAIREGVLKTLQITEKHFRELYNNIPYHYYIYDSSNISQVRQFALSSSIEIMIMTIDSFNKASNVIRQSIDRLQGDTPIHLVQATRPILILDEPQNMESELRIKALANLDPIFALRYSATHRNPYNIVYRLTPYEAYRMGLVKHIEVAGVTKEDDFNQVFIRLNETTSEKTKVSAKLSVHKLMKDGTVKEQIVKVKLGDSLADKTDRPEYKSFVIEEISPFSEIIRFTNGIELGVGNSRGADKEAIFETQIRYTIEEHFIKHQRLKSEGIKVLSLFFIDRVDNYKSENGIIRLLFNKCFNEIKTRYDDWRDVDAESVQASYFAQRQVKGGEIIFEDSKTGEAEKDKKAYDLIMRDKERLLSYDEPSCFIFSHSALREGWDNPNIFQICTLNQSVSEIKKRQEIGRGVRLAVNQSGERIQENKVNILTVIANESYERYVERLQTEIEEEYGNEGLPPRPDNAREPKVTRLRKEYLLKPEFKELWEKIKHKTRYAVTIDTEKLVSDVLSELNIAEIHHPQISITKAALMIEKDDNIIAQQTSTHRTAMDLSERYSSSNLIEIVEHLMDYTSPPMRLSRQTLAQVLNQTKNQKAQSDNPQEFASLAVRIIKEKLSDQLINGIKYEKINEWYEMTQFEMEMKHFADLLIPAERSLYDHIAYESDIERDFVFGLEKRRDVILYTKLPGWFTVPTPIGEYNPDWAIIIQPHDKHGELTGEPLLCLVRETKGTTDLSKLRPEESKKIRCGERHFIDTLKTDFKIITSVDELI